MVITEVEIFPGYISCHSHRFLSLESMAVSRDRNSPVPLTNTHPDDRILEKESVRRTRPSTSMDRNVGSHGWMTAEQQKRAEDWLYLFYYWVLSYQSSNREAIREVSIWLPLHANLSHTHTHTHRHRHRHRHTHTDTHTHTHTDTDTHRHTHRHRHTTHTHTHIDTDTHRHTHRHRHTTHTHTHRHRHTHTHTHTHIKLKCTISDTIYIHK